MTPAQLTAELKRQASALGFAAAGACPAVTAPGWPRLADWLAAGYDGDMHYFRARQQAYQHPRHVLAGAQSLLVMAFPYRTSDPQPTHPGTGRIASYAWGTDYHELIHRRLEPLVAHLRQLVPGAAARGVVDSAPLLEREYAQLAGLGWIGKNGLLLSRELGSWFFLAVLLTDIELAYDLPHTADHCGTCTACLDACPTQAFVAPYRLDPRRCISYLTIELRAEIPPELRPGLGDWLFGCDVCQEVCPWNRHAPATAEPDLAPRPAQDPLALGPLFATSDEEFRRRFRDTPLWRARRRGLLRNAALVLGNQADPAALPALAQALADPEPLVRQAAAWALGRIPHPAAHEWLMARRSVEIDPAVRQEITAALGNFG